MKMPFSKKGINWHNNRLTIGTKYILSRRTLKSFLSRSSKIKLPQVTNCFLLKNKKRAASFAFRREAFISIEAAICLSVFMLATLSLLSFGTIMNQKMQVEIALRNTASKIAQDYSLYDSITGEKAELFSKYLIKGVGIVATKQLFIDELGKDRIDNSAIKNGSSGISFWYSDIVDDEGYVDIIVTYKMDLPFKVIPIPEIRMTQRSRIHSWTGVAVFGEDSEEYVYVTANGTVYHISISCRHLNINATKVSKTEISSVRNNSGGKYYECKICCKDQEKSVYYITKSGTAYHESKDCPALTRNVKKVPISECVGMPVCKSCGE